MTLEQKTNRALWVTAIGAICFGLWQTSFWAGSFMLCALLFLGGLVVAVQDGFKHLIAACDQIPPADRDKEDEL